jgi:hypothetical protein
VLLTQNTADMRKQLLIFESTANAMGLKINFGPGKTEYIQVSAGRINDLELEGITSLDGTAVRRVTTYKYLGTVLGRDWKDDFSRRKRLAFAVIREYSYVWRSEATVDAKHNLFMALVEPLLMYGVFTYPWTRVVQEESPYARCDAKDVHSAKRRC